MTKADRQSCIRALLDFSTSISELRSRLKGFPWDYEGEEELLTRAQLRNALSRYFAGEITDTDIEVWANLIENREDVGFQSGYERQIRDVVFELANPALTHRLDKNRASILIRELAAVATLEPNKRGPSD
jgi:hypothetical protein